MVCNICEDKGKNREVISQNNQRIKITLRDGLMYFLIITKL